MQLGLDEKVIKSIVNTLKEYEGIEEIRIFGSRAKGTHKKGSDIDIAIFAKGLDFTKLCEMSDKLDALNLPYEIQLVDYYNITNQALKEHIDRVGVKIG